MKSFGRRMAKSPAQEPLPKASKKPKVLVLDDDPIVREMTAALFAIEGFEVQPLDRGPEDELFYAHLNIDAAIIDLGLPGLPGIDVIERIRAKPHGKVMPIFVITASTNAGMLADCYNETHKATVYLKPVDWQVMIRDLKKALGSEAGAALQTDTEVA